MLMTVLPAGACGPAPTDRAAEASPPRKCADDGCRFARHVGEAGISRIGGRCSAGRGLGQGRLCRLLRGSLRSLARGVHLRGTVEIIPPEQDDERQANGEEKVLLFAGHVLAWCLLMESAWNGRTSGSGSGCAWPCGEALVDPLHRAGNIVFQVGEQARKRFPSGNDHIIARCTIRQFVAREAR